MPNLEAIPLSRLDPDIHGLNFVNIFPQGIDEDRIIIHINRLNNVALVGNLGGITVAGAISKAADTTPEINGIDQNGNAFAALIGIKRRQPLGEGVAVIAAKDCTECADAEANPNNGEYYHRAPTIIVMNTQERDRRLQESKKYQKDLMDPLGHADSLNALLSEGLSDAVKIRYRQSDPAHHKELATLGSAGFGLVALQAIYGLPTAALMTGLVIPISSLLTNEMVARRNEIIYGTHRSELPATALVGLDRLFIARTLAKYSRFVEVAK